MPSVADQVSSFFLSLQNNNDIDTARFLFILWAGANDIFFNPNISAAQSFLEISSLSSRLLSAFPRATIVTIASPDLSRLPYGFYVDEITKTQLRSFTDLLAVLLAQAGNQAGAAKDAKNVQNVDLRNLFDQFEYYAAPQDYGFAPFGKYGSCLVGTYGEGSEGANGTITECDDAGDKVYWDEYQLVYEPFLRRRPWET